MVDLNSDLGEGFGTWTLGDDAAMLRVVTSANIACGFHAGDPATLLRTCADAVRSDVRIGAQVGYRDLVGFGRRFLDVTAEDLRADVIYQIGALDGLARSVGGRVQYVKPHGALYNTIVHHRVQAQAVVDAVTAYDPGLPVLGLPGSAFLDIAARAGLRTVTEAFADRGYTAAGTLVSRRDHGAVLSDVDAVARRVLRMVTEGVVDSVDGVTVPVNADSVCLHGDTPAAVAMALAVRDVLSLGGVTLTPFVS